MASKQVRSRKVLNQDSSDEAWEKEAKRMGIPGLETGPLLKEDVLGFDTALEKWLGGE